MHPYIAMERQSTTLVHSSLYHRPDDCFTRSHLPRKVTVIWIQRRKQSTGIFLNFQFPAPKTKFINPCCWRFTWPFLIEARKKVLDVSEECWEKKEFIWALHHHLRWELASKPARTMSLITSRSWFRRNKRAPTHCQMSSTLTLHTGAMKTKSESTGLETSITSATYALIALRYDPT